MFSAILCVCIYSLTMLKKTFAYLIVTPLLVSTLEVHAQNMPNSSATANNTLFAERYQYLQQSQKQEPLVYNRAPYDNLFEKLQLDQKQTWAWERVVRAHQAKSKAMQPLFETREAVGTLGHIQAEIKSVKAILENLSPEKRLSSGGRDIANVLKTMEVTEGALRSFYKLLSPYQQREFEIHQINMIDGIRQ